MPAPRKYLNWVAKPSHQIYQGYFRIPGRGVVRRKLASFSELGLDDSGAATDKTKRAKQARAGLLSKSYDKIRAELMDGAAPRGGSRPVKDVFQDWISDTQNTRADATLRLYLLVANDYVKSAGDHLISDISGARINRFAGDLSMRMARNTVRNRLSTLRTFLNWAVDGGDLDAVPKFRMPPHEKKLPLVLSAPDLEKLEIWLSVLRRFGPKKNRKFYRLHQRAFWVGMETGARESEVFFLRWKDIDLENYTITFRFFENFRIKEGEEKTIPITLKLAMFLADEKRKATGEIWLLDDGAGALALYAPKALNKAIRRHMDALGVGAGVKPFHGLRALYAHRLRVLKVDIYTIKNLLGHRQVSTTEGYFPAQRDPETAAVALLDAP